MHYKSIILILLSIQLTINYKPISHPTLPEFDSDLLSIRLDLFRFHKDSKKFLFTVTMLNSALKDLQNEKTKLLLKNLFMGYSNELYLPAFNIVHWTFSFNSGENKNDLKFKSFLIEFINSSDKNIEDKARVLFGFLKDKTALNSFGEMKPHFIPQGKLKEGRLLKLDKNYTPEIAIKCPVDIFIYLRFYETKKHVVLKTEQDFEFERNQFRGSRAVQTFSMEVEGKNAEIFKRVGFMLGNIYLTKQLREEVSINK